MTTQLQLLAKKDMEFGRSTVAMETSILAPIGIKKNRLNLMQNFPCSRYQGGGACAKQPG